MGERENKQFRKNELDKVGQDRHHSNFYYTYKMTQQTSRYAHKASWDLFEDLLENKSHISKTDLYITSYL